MQFPTAATLILLGAISLASASLTLSKRQALSQVNVYSDTSCSNYMTTVSTSGSGAGNGECFTFGSRVFGADTTELTGGCDVTVYSDGNCSDDATLASLNQCVGNGNGWGSFSTDNCS